MGPDDVKWFIEALSARGNGEVGEQTRHALAHVLERRTIKTGEVLYADGSVPDSIWCIRTGAVELMTRLGGRRSVVQVLRAGALAGDVPILLGSPSLVTARVRDGGTALALSGDALPALLTESPDLARLWMHSLAVRLERARVRILEFLGRGLSHSVAQLLLNEATDGCVDLSQAAIAEMLGVQRSSVNRVIGALRRAGFLSSSYGRICVEDEEGLRTFAFGSPPSVF